MAGLLPTQKKKTNGAYVPNTLPDERSRDVAVSRDG